MYVIAHSFVGSARWTRAPYSGTKGSPICHQNKEKFCNEVKLLLLCQTNCICRASVSSIIPIDRPLNSFVSYSLNAPHRYIYRYIITRPVLCNGKDINFLKRNVVLCGLHYTYMPFLLKIN